MAKDRALTLEALRVMDAIDAGPVGGAIRAAAGAGGHEFGVRIGQADDQHAVVQQRDHHRQIGRASCRERV